MRAYGHVLTVGMMVVAALSPALGAEEPADLLDDGDMETVTVSNWPANKADDATCAITSVDSPVKEGRRALLIQGTGAWMSANSRQVAVTPGTRYLATAWIRTMKGQARIQFDCFENGKWLGSHSDPTRVTKDEWTAVRIASDVTNYPKATHVSIGIVADGPDVEVYVDDVAMSVIEWQEDFGIATRVLAATGSNTYFILEPGFQLVFESEDEKLVITVLDDTIDVAGVTTRVVEEREWKDKELVEVSRNFFAICRDTADVFYFGEDVDDYLNGQIVGHGGAWRAGSHDARPGLMMPGSPTAGMKYYQEIAPGTAMDRAEVISLKETHKTPAGAFDKCLKVQEGSALKPSEKEFKIYAPGIGLIQDADLLLTSYGFVKKQGR